MKSNETKAPSSPIGVYFPYSEDYAETDSGWELRKHETSEDSVESKNIEVVERTSTSKIRSGTALHASSDDFSDRRTLFPQSTDAEIEALLHCFLPNKVARCQSEAKSNVAVVVAREQTRTVSEIMCKLVRPIVQSESSHNEDSTSSTTTSTLLISPSASKRVSKD